LDHRDPLRLWILAGAGRILDALQRLTLGDVGARAVEAAFFAVPQREADRPLRLNPGIGEDARQLHHERRARSVVIGGLVVAMAVHVRADDVHLIGVLRPDLRDVDLVDRTGDDWPGVERANLLVRLRHGVAVHARARAVADDSAAALPRSRVGAPAAGIAAP